MTAAAIHAFGTLLKMGDGGMAAGTNEVQTLSATGTPTAGNFKINNRGQVTAPIAYNATAAAVRTALEALGNIAEGQVATSGGPLPGSAVVITFQAGLGGQDIPLMTVVESTVTGGSFSIATTTPGTAGAEVFATVAEVREVPVPGLEAATIDVTTHDSPGGVREFIMNIPDLPDISFDIFYLPAHATHDENTGLLAKNLLRTLVNFKVVYNITPSKVCTFQGYITRFVPRAPVDNVWSANVRIKPASVPTWGST